MWRLQWNAAVSTELLCQISKVRDCDWQSELYYRFSQDAFHHIMSREERVRSSILHTSKICQEMHPKYIAMFVPAMTRLPSGCWPKSEVLLSQWWKQLWRIKGRLPAGTAFRLRLSPCAILPARSQAVFTSISHYSSILTTPCTNRAAWYRICISLIILWKVSDWGDLSEDSPHFRFSQGMTTSRLE